MKQYNNDDPKSVPAKPLPQEKNNERLENQYKNLLQRVNDQTGTIEKLQRDVSRLKDSINILARK